MAKKIETSVERYRRIKAEKAKNETLIDVECECSMIWKCRKVGIDFWISSGTLPLHLVETMVKATNKGGDKNDILSTLVTKELIETFQFSNKVVKHTAVVPHIVETPSGPDDISQEEVDTCCYKRLLDWQIYGGDEAATLENFPQ